MSYIHQPAQLAPVSATEMAKPSIWKRLLDAVDAGGHHDSERVWLDLIARNGGRLTDEVERRISLSL